ncbi:hypothetical protein HID58_086056 [Brassica napus]|uniref:Uncharacterized protein n=1 Tax=Brassica napus TaxID=3708 RepID=A0ABQ7XPC6_BRANA|nr:hypothetical protein HID58_086056 [Brassica napus]
MTRRHHHHHRWLLSPPSPSLPSPIARHHHHCWWSIQGRHRHPASDSVVNEKYLNAGSGNDLTEVRKICARALLNVAAEQPDMERLLQKHFTCFGGRQHALQTIRHAP